MISPDRGYEGRAYSGAVARLPPKLAEVAVQPSGQQIRDAGVHRTRTAWLAGATEYATAQFASASVVASALRMQRAAPRFVERSITASSGHVPGFRGDHGSSSTRCDPGDQGPRVERDAGAPVGGGPGPAQHERKPLAQPAFHAAGSDQHQFLRERVGLGRPAARRARRRCGSARSARCR